MTIDTELVAQVQLLADESRTHRVKSLIACYVGFISLLESNPELKERALKLEKTLRAYRSTGVLPPSPAEAAAMAELGPPRVPERSEVSITRKSALGA